MKSLLLAILGVALLSPATVRGQALQPRGKEKAEEKRPTPPPRQYLPPPGMCRIWVDNVPAARQAAPTDCATAIRNRPPNARVIFSPDRNTRQKNLAPQPPRARPDTTRRKPPT